MPDTDAPLVYYNIFAQGRDEATTDLYTAPNGADAVLFRGDGEERRMGLVRPAAPSAKRLFDSVDPTGAVIEWSVGALDKSAASGTFDGDYEGDSTGLEDIPFNVDQTTLRDLLNTNPGVTASGATSVRVAKVDARTWKIQWDTPGARSVLNFNPANLTPGCNASCIRSVTGDSTHREEQILRIVRRNYAFTSDWAATTSTASVGITTAQIGTATKPSIQKVSITPDPSDGTFQLNFARKQKTRITCKDNAGAVKEVVSIAARGDNGRREKVDVQCGPNYTYALDGDYIDLRDRAGIVRPWFSMDKTKVGDTTSGSPDINITTGGTTFLAVGMPVSGTGIPAGATIAEIGGGSGDITLSANATATGVSVTLTFGSVEPAIPENGRLIEVPLVNNASNVTVATALRDVLKLDSQFLTYRTGSVVTVQDLYMGERDLASAAGASGFAISRKAIGADSTLHDKTAALLHDDDGDVQILVSKGGPSEVAVPAGARRITALVKDDVMVASNSTATFATAFAEGQTLDGVSLLAGYRILLFGRSSAAENGIYVVQASGAPVRAEDFDSWDELDGAIVSVGTAAGATNGSKTFKASAALGGTLGSTAINFTDLSVFSSGGSSIFIGTVTRIEVTGPQWITVAVAIKEAINADSAAAFTATRNVGTVSVENATFGVRELPEAGTSQMAVVRYVAGAYSELHDKALTLFDDVNHGCGLYFTETGDAPAVNHDVRDLPRFIVVTIAHDDTATEIGAAIEAITDDDFTFDNDAGVVEVTNAVEGLRDLAADISTGFGIATLITGLALSVDVPYDASALDIAQLLGNGFVVTQTGNFAWNIQFPENGPQSLFTATATGLSVPLVLKGSLRLNTDSCYMAFVDAGQDEIDALEEGKVTFPGKSPRVFFQRKVRLKKSLIDFESVAPDAVAVSLPLRLIAYPSVRGLTGGSGKLDGIPTIGLENGQPVLIRAAGEPRIWELAMLPIVSSSVADSTVITTSFPHELTTGDVVAIGGHGDSTPDINADTRTVTVLTDTTFSIPVNVTVGGAGGYVTPATNAAGGVVRGTDFNRTSNPKFWQSVL